MKDNQGFKRVFIGIMVMLLVWNGYTTYQLYELRSKSTTKTESGKVVETKVSEFVTEPTKVVENVKDKVVTVVNKYGEQEQGSGSGVIYSNANGVVQVITNHHVIDKGTNFLVRLADGTEYEATLKGSDPYTDLALLEMKENIDVEPIKIGDSNVSKVGEYVLAIGSPVAKEFANSVTFGIISGKERSVPVDVNKDGQPDWDMIVMQTDAAINPGNSGGALVNMAGELIGINSMKLSSNQIEGMGFSIPINEVVPIIKQIEEKGEVKYPIIGISAVSIEDINPYQRSYYKLDDSITSGVFIAKLTNQSPAQVAGIKVGDVITKFDGVAVKNFKTFRRLLYGKQVGDVVKLEINRYGSVSEVEVTLQ